MCQAALRCALDPLASLRGTGAGAAAAGCSAIVPQDDWTRRRKAASDTSCAAASSSLHGPKAWAQDVGIARMQVARRGSRCTADDAGYVTVVTQLARWLQAPVVHGPLGPSPEAACGPTCRRRAATPAPPPPPAGRGTPPAAPRPCACAPDARTPQTCAVAGPPAGVPARRQGTKSHGKQLCGRAAAPRAGLPCATCNSFSYGSWSAEQVENELAAEEVGRAVLHQKDHAGGTAPNAHPLINDALLLLRQCALLEALEQVLRPVSMQMRLGCRQQSSQRACRHRLRLKTPTTLVGRRHQWQCQPARGPHTGAKACSPVRADLLCALHKHFAQRVLLARSGVFLVTGAFHGASSRFRALL